MENRDESVNRVLLAVAMRRRGMKPERTQEAIAHEAGVSLRHYQKIEAGLGDPRLSTLLRVAAALDTTLQSLLDKADP